jgi:hypothetical protein
MNEIQRRQPVPPKATRASGLQSVQKMSGLTSLLAATRPSWSKIIPLLSALYAKKPLTTVSNAVITVFIFLPPID